MSKYKMYVQRTLVENGVIVVEANTEDEAYEVADNMIDAMKDEHPDITWDGNPDVTDVEVVDALLEARELAKPEGQG